MRRGVRNMAWPRKPGHVSMVRKTEIPAPSQARLTFSHLPRETMVRGEMFGGEDFAVRVRYLWRKESTNLDREEG